MGDVIDCVILVILEHQLFELTSSLDVVEGAELVSVESNKGHWKVRVISDFTNLINEIDLISEAVEVGELELRDGEKIGGLLHGGFQLLELVPIVVELAPICQVVHLSVEVGEEIIEFLWEVLQVFGFSLEFHLSVFKSAFFSCLNI